MAGYRGGETDPFEDELRRRFAAVPVQVPVDVGAVLAKGRSARRRQFGLLFGGLALLVVVAIVAVFAGIQYGQQHARSGELPDGFNPASPSPTRPVTALPALPRITVNGTTETGLSVDAATMAVVQHFADDVADGNLDSIVAHCWTQPETDLRARWSDGANRTKALSMLVTPGIDGDLGVPGQLEWTAPAAPGQSSTPDDVLVFDPQEVASGYACPLPSSLTAAQASLTIERLVNRQDGTPYQPSDTQANYPLLSCDGFDMDFAWKGDYTTEWAASSLSDIQPVCDGTTDAQWATLDSIVGQKLVEVDATSVGLLADDFHVFTPLADPAIQIVFVAMFSAARDFPSWSGQAYGLYAVVGSGSAARSPSTDAGSGSPDEATPDDGTPDDGTPADETGDDEFPASIGG